MSIKVHRQSCSHEFRRPETMGGRMVKCPECKRATTIPNSVADSSQSDDESQKTSRQTSRTRTNPTAANHDPAIFRRTAPGDPGSKDLTVVDWFVTIVLPVPGLIIGLMRYAQGKRSAPMMLGVSLIVIGLQILLAL